MEKMIKDIALFIGQCARRKMTGQEISQRNAYQGCIPGVNITLENVSQSSWCREELCCCCCRCRCCCCRCCRCCRCCCCRCCRCCCCCCCCSWCCSLTIFKKVWRICSMCHARPIRSTETHHLMLVYLKTEP